MEMKKDLILVQIINFMVKDGVSFQNQSLSFVLNIKHV